MTKNEMNEMIELQSRFIDACEERIRIQDEIIENQEEIIANTEKLAKLEKLESYKQGYKDALVHIQELCEDAISRKEAILLFQRYGVGCFDPDDFSVETATRFVIKKLEELEPICNRK